MFCLYLIAGNFEIFESTLAQSVVVYVLTLMWKFDLLCIPHLNLLCLSLTDADLHVQLR